MTRKKDFQNMCSTDIQTSPASGQAGEAASPAPAVSSPAPSGAELLPDLPDVRTEGRIKRFFRYITTRRYSYLFYAFIIPVALYYLVYLSMGLHPFGNGSVLVLDLNGQYVYFYEALRNAVYGKTSLIYSFCRSLGGEFFGIYAYYIASPFSYIVCLFPQDRILEALLCIFLLKAGISGVTMGYYLDRISSKPAKINIVMFSVLYSMCSYAVVQQHNSMWIDALMWLPLLTLGIEELIRHKKYRLFVVMLALTMLSNFYIGYMVCIYTLVYFFYYYFSRNENGRNNPENEPFHFRRSFLRIGFFSLIAIGMSMIIVATAYYSLQFGKNTFSNPDFSFDIRFDLMDFFTRLLPGAYDTVRPEGLPFLYCGVLTLYCLPLYFCARKFSVREKIFAAAIIGFFFLCFSINTVDMIWHGFQKPNWLNYRYSFILCFIMVALGYRGYGEIRKLSAKITASFAVLFIFFLTVAQKFKFHAIVGRVGGKTEFDQPLEELMTVWLSLVFFAVIAVVLCASAKTKRPQTLSLILCIIVCVEAFANAIVCCVEFGNDVIYSSYSSYNDFIRSLRPLTDEITETDRTFYRFEKNAHRKYCDNMALNIRGITNSTSTLNKSTIEFLDKIGYAARSHWSKYLGGTPVNDSLIGIKYIIAAEKDHLEDYYTEAGFSPVICNSTEYRTYINPYALPLSFGVDDALAEFDMKDSTPMSRLNRLVAAMLGEEECRIFVPLEYDESTVNCTTSTIAGHWKYTHTVADSDATVIYTFKTVRDGEVFFYLPSDYAREVRVKVNGASLGNFYGGETTRIFSLGRFEAGEEVTLSMTLDADVLYVKQDVDAVYQLDFDEFKSAFARLAQTGYDTGEDWKPTRFSGKVTTSSDSQLMLTSLTFDEGWKIRVDGKPVETEKTLGALISYRIEGAGEHTVTMVYRPNVLVFGNIVSIASLLLFILIIIFEKPLKEIMSHFEKQSKKTEGDDLLADELLLSGSSAYGGSFAPDGDPRDIIDMYGSDKAGELTEDKKTATGTPPVEEDATDGGAGEAPEDKGSSGTD